MAFRSFIHEIDGTRSSLTEQSSSKRYSKSQRLEARKEQEAAGNGLELDILKLKINILKKLSYHGFSRFVLYF